MTKVNIKEFATNESNNKGINREHALCAYFGIERTKHDSTSYDKGSDIEVDGMNISVKSAGATLMSGTFCKTCKTFAGIWRKYRMNVHSDTFAFVTEDYTVYFMDINEFSRFVHKFATLTRESSKNGGYPKIQLKKNNAMVEWLEERVA